MKLWIIRRREYADWDEYEAFVISAETEERARLLAKEEALEAEKKIWLDPEYTTCHELTVDEPEGVVLADFHAG
jgi:hypothetical protein